MMYFIFPHLIQVLNRLLKVSLKKTLGKKYKIVVNIGVALAERFWHCAGNLRDGVQTMAPPGNL